MQAIDVHTHIFPPDIIRERERYLLRDRWFGTLYAGPRARMATAEELIAAMDLAGVTQSITFGFAFRDGGLCRACNDYALQAQRDHADRLAMLAVVNPCEGAPALHEAERCLQAGAAGVGELMPDGQEFALTDEGVLGELLELLRRQTAPLMLHVNEPVGHDYAGKGCHGPAEALNLALRHPENVLVLAHWGGGLPFYELMPEVRLGLRNVYYDTSASPLLYDDAIYRHVMAWAPDKVLWGSDYPLIQPQRFLRRLERAGLEPELRERLLWRNAWQVFGRLRAGREGTADGADTGLYRN